MYDFSASPHPNLNNAMRAKSKFTENILHCIWIWHFKSAINQHNRLKSYDNLKRCKSRGCILMVEFHGRGSTSNGASIFRFFVAYILLRYIYGRITIKENHVYTGNWYCMTIWQDLWFTSLYFSYLWLANPKTPAKPQTGISLSGKFHRSATENVVVEGLCTTAAKYVQLM